MRAFFAHPKGMNEDIAKHLVNEIKRHFKKHDIDAEVVTGLEDFNANIGSEGTFDAWAKSVPNRVDTFTGRRVYDAIIVYERVMGKATAMIATEAFGLNIPVYSLSEQDKYDIELYEASQVAIINPDNYIAGWELVVPDYF